MIDVIFKWLDSANNTVALAIVGGVVGFIAKAVYDLWLARRNDQLDRVNQQLRMLYGPLYALNEAGGIAWRAFRSKVRPNVQSFFGSSPPPTKAELAAWRIWMLTVFQPIHDEMLSTITKNADLLIENDMPQQLKDFCAHVMAYKVVFEKWKIEDFSEHVSIANYPTKEMNGYLEMTFRILKKKQATLLGSGAQQVAMKVQNTRPKLNDC